MDYYDKVTAKTFKDLSAKRVKLFLKQGIGGQAIPVVTTGDSVQMGDVIATIKEGAPGSVLHASISGKVTVFDDCIEIE